MRNPLKFAKPKGPGFGIAKGMYLQVLLAEATPPAIADLVAPTSDTGAIEGFGVPLAGSDKTLLLQPMRRGQYALASKDRKTVVKMLLMPVQEAGFDADTLVRSPLATAISPETLARARSAWHIAQFTYEAHDPDVYPALDFLLDAVIRLADLTSGVVIDPICKRYLLPTELDSLRVLRPVDARAHVSIGRDPTGGDGVGSESFTLGLQKFAMPEFVVTGLDDAAAPHAERYLLSAAQGVLEAHPVVSGSRLPIGRTAFELREAVPRGRWEGTPALELLPPTGKSSGELLAEF